MVPRAQAVIVAAAAALVMLGCGRDTSPAARFPEEPSSCAGEPKGPLEELRQEQWDAAATEVNRADSGTVRVWLGFSRTLSVDDAQRLVSALDIAGLQLAAPDPQGGVGQSQQTLPSPIPANDLRRVAEELVDRGSRATRVEAEDATGPAHPAEAGAEPPVSALQLVGEAELIVDLVTENECLVYSAAPGIADDAPPISPAIEPAPAAAPEDAP